ncbi:MAG: RasGEF domain-containing protein [Candidatus Paracaedibacter sp.]
MLNKIISFALFCLISFVPTYAMEPEITNKIHEITAQVSTSNRDVRDKASLDLSPYKSFPPVELDQTLLECLFSDHYISINPGDTKNPTDIPYGHILYNAILFGSKVSDDKYAKLQDILEKHKKITINDSVTISAILVENSIDPRSANTFSVKDTHPESVLAQYDVYIGENLYQESDKKFNSGSHPFRFMLSVTKNKPSIANKKTITPQLSTSDKYKKSLSALFRDSGEADSESLKTILYTYPFFINGKTLLANLQEIIKEYPDKVKNFLRLLAKEISLGGKESMSFDEDDLNGLTATWPDIFVDYPTTVQPIPFSGEFYIAKLIANKKLNNDNYVDVINLNEDEFGKTLWARDIFLLQSIPLKDLNRTHPITPLAWYSTQTSLWVAFQILTAQTTQARKEMFSKFLAVGNSLVDENNVHGAMQIIFGLSNGTVQRVMENPPHKDKHENDLLKDPSWLKLQTLAMHPNADKHYNTSNPNRFLSFSALSGKVINWCEEYDSSKDGNVDLLGGIAKVAEKFVSLQRQTFSKAPKLQYSKLVCGIGFCDFGEIRQETLTTISSLLKEYPAECLDAIDASIPRIFEDLRDDCFSNFLKNKGCEKKIILKIFSRGIFSGQQLIQHIQLEGGSFKKIEKLCKLAIPESVAKSILHAQYAERLDPKDYTLVSVKEEKKEVKESKKQAEKTRKKSSSKK